ncbi:MAG: hypothetical protein NT166_20790 [Candidatus Aminicenantes bacterium]|nr:hypothetical protein [Candidatus Aminicenantes bacterium]
MKSTLKKEMLILIILYLASFTLTIFPVAIDLDRWDKGFSSSSAVGQLNEFGVGAVNVPGISSGSQVGTSSQGSSSHDNDNDHSSGGDSSSIDPGPSWETIQDSKRNDNYTSEQNSISNEHANGVTQDHYEVIYSHDAANAYARESQRETRRRALQNLTAREKRENDMDFRKLVREIAKMGISNKVLEPYMKGIFDIYKFDKNLLTKAKNSIELTIGNGNANYVTQYLVVDGKTILIRRAINEANKPIEDKVEYDANFRTYRMIRGKNFEEVQYYAYDKDKNKFYKTGSNLLEVYRRNWFNSNYIGPNNPTSGKVEPLNLADMAAKLHDMDYDKAGARGFGGALLNLDDKVLEADKHLIYRALSIYILAEVKPDFIDPYSGESIRNEKDTAKNILKGFRVIVGEKNLRKDFNNIMTSLDKAIGPDNFPGGSYRWK